MPRTRKPCHGCGEKPEYEFREAESVCAACKRLMEDGREFRNREESDQKTVMVSFPFASHALPYIPNAYTDYDDRHDGHFKKAFFDLAHRLSSPTTKYRSNSAQLTTAPYDVELSGNQMMSKDVVDLMRKLYDLTTAMVEASYQKGYASGGDLLGEIARGRVSIKELNELTIQGG